ncbi:MAG: TlpA family protein disulfide reductase [Rhodothermales bacterium]|nr:TlpA family protein disulfide reductase [Rhodothermales bacterium]MBO6779723.1 TlpA family protein disulfide reductase [Rhodothermales bacterium]
MRLLPVLLILLTACGRGDVPPGEATELPYEEEAPVVASEQLRPAPEFERPALDGTTYRLADRKGQVVIVNFWATWCGPCIRETPAFVDLANEWQDRPFEIVGVSLDDEGFEVIRPFVERYEVPYPMVLDDGALADEFGGVYAMPSSFILNKEGRIVHRVVGEFPFEEMRDELEALLDA